VLQRFGTRRLRATGVGMVGLAIGAVVVMAGPAWAHVSISPPSAPKGSDAVLSFNVPNESEDASTTEVAIVFPTDHPIAEAAVLPIAGWTATVATVKVDQPIQTDEGEVTEAVSRVTWTGGKIDPGQFQQFTVSVGLPDDADELVFKALQSYSDGSKVSWIEEETPGGAEPEHPAPVLTLTEAGDGATATTTPATTNTATATKDLAKQSDVDSAKTLGVLGLIVGALGLIAAIGAFTIKRRS
jgi:uncharacterized protein YcnI